MRSPELDGYVEQVRADWSNVGVAVSIVQGSEASYVRGFGPRQIDRSEPIDSNTAFQIGSLSKAFAATALGMLVEEGRIAWDDPVINRVPDFQLRDPQLTREVTLRDIVAHRSGISHNVYPFLGIVDTEAALQELRFIATEGAFRDSFVYSNLMYAVIGKIIEAASGLSWHRFVKQRLLQPLGMDRSGTSPFEFWSAAHVTPTYLGSAPAGRWSLEYARDRNLAMPHGRDEHGEAAILPWQSYDNAAPAGSLIASAADVAKWMVFNLNEGRFPGQQLLRPDTLEVLHAPQNLCGGEVPFPFEGECLTYAMGWWRTRYRGEACLVHSGGMIGFPSYTVLLPQQRIGVTVLANSWHLDESSFHKSIVFGVLDRLLGVTPGEWSRDLLERARQTHHAAQASEEQLSASRRPNTTPSLPLEAYVGDYEDASSVSGRIMLRLEGEQLVLSFAGNGAYRAALEHWHDDVFRLHSSLSAAHVLGTLLLQFILRSAVDVVSMSVFGATLYKRTG